MLMTGFVVLLSYYMNKATVRCCYERRGYMDDLRRVNRLLYLMPTICTAASMIGLTIVFAASTKKPAACGVRVFLLLTPLCAWVVATFVKTSNIPPGLTDRHVQDISEVCTRRRPRRYKVKDKQRAGQAPPEDTEEGQQPAPKGTTGAAGTPGTTGPTGSTGTVARHPFADPVQEEAPVSRPRGRKHDVEMADLGMRRDSQDSQNSRYSHGIQMEAGADSDVGSGGALHVETSEEVRGYARAAVTLFLCLGTMFVYAMASSGIGSDAAFAIGKCDIGQLQVLHIVSMAIFFTIVSFAAVIRAFSIPALSYTVRMCQRSSFLCLAVSILTLVWFSWRSMFTDTGGEFLITVSIILAMVEQITWGAPYMVALSGSASAVADKGRPQVYQDQDEGPEQAGNQYAWPTPRRRDSSLIDVDAWSVPHGTPSPGPSSFGLRMGLPELHPSVLDLGEPASPVAKTREADKKIEKARIAEILAGDDDDDDEDEDADEDDDNWDDDGEGNDIDVWFTGSRTPQPMKRLPSGAPEKPKRPPPVRAAVQEEAPEARPRIARPDVSALMENAPALVYLHEFMAEKGCEDLLEYLVNSEIDFAHMNKPRITVVEWLFRTFIVEDAPKNLHVSSDARRESLGRLEKLRHDVGTKNVGVVNLSDAPFEPASREVRAFVNTQIMPAFLQSDKYRRYLSGAVIPAEVQERVARPSWYSSIAQPTASMRLIVSPDGDGDADGDGDGNDYPDLSSIQ